MLQEVWAELRSYYIKLFVSSSHKLGHIVILKPDEALKLVKVWTLTWDKTFK